MELTLTKDVLLKSLQLMEPIVSGRSALPISSDVLIQTKEKNKCVLIATDIETALKTEVDCKITRSGEICLPAKKLLEAVRELPEEEIVFKTKDDKSPIGELFCGKIKNTFVGQPAKNHPGMPTIDEKQNKNVQIAITADVLHSALLRTVFATSKEETRYYLNGVYFNIQKDTAKFVATDGRRLAYVVRKIDGNKVSTTGIVPTKSVHRIIEIIEKIVPAEVRFSISTGHFVLEANETLFVSRLVQGEFPAYEQVIPKTKSLLNIASDKLLKGIKQVSWVMPEKGFGIKFLFTADGLKISSIVESVGNSEVEIPLEYSGKEVEVKFEPDYLVEMISVLNTKTELIVGMNEPSSPWTFQPKEDTDYLYILMPMKL